MNVAPTKHRQHYVWQHYLAAWATDRGKLWCQRGDSRFQAMTENVAVRRDYYRLHEMSAADVAFIEMFFGRLGTTQRDLALSWLPYFTKLHELKRIYESSAKPSAEVEALLQKTINDLEEDFHGAVENDAVPILAALRRADTSFLADDGTAASFCLFLAMQHLRTPRIRRRGIEALSIIPGINAEAVQGVLRTAVASLIGGSLFAQRRRVKITFLEAAGTARFIAGDQPLVNLRAGPGDDLDTPPTELELYYPLSPDLAVTLDFEQQSGEIDRRQLTEAEVRAYNGEIVADSEEQYFAGTAVGLDAFDLPIHDAKPSLSK